MFGWIILAALAAFVAVLIVRTLRFTPLPDAPASDAPVDVDADKAVRDLQALIRCKTVSYRDKSLEDDNEFACLEALLPEMFPTSSRPANATSPTAVRCSSAGRGRAMRRPACSWPTTTWCP